MSRPVAERLWPVDALPARHQTLNSLTRLAGVNGTDAIAVMSGDRMLTLAQADRIAVAIGESLDTLWPGINPDYTRRSPVRRKQSIRSPYEDPHHVVALRETGLTRQHIARILRIHPGRVSATLSAWTERKNAA
jgi:plasmid maintenance system antidote protein VapI